MAGSFKTEAIVLRSIRYGEADRVLHLYTADRGRVGAVAKGASIDDYRHIDGAQGSFQDRFLVHLRKGKPCVRCGTKIQKMRAAGRGTYICPRCQRLRRK